MEQRKLTICPAPTTPSFLTSAAPRLRVVLKQREATAGPVRQRPLLRVAENMAASKDSFSKAEETQRRWKKKERRTRTRRPRDISSRRLNPGLSMPPTAGIRTCRPTSAATLGVGGRYGGFSDAEEPDASTRDRRAPIGPALPLTRRRRSRCD